MLSIGSAKIMDDVNHPSSEIRTTLGGGEETQSFASADLPQIHDNAEKRFVILALSADFLDSRTLSCIMFLCIEIKMYTHTSILYMHSN